MSGDVGILSGEAGYAEANAYFLNPSTTRVPDETHHAYLKGTLSYILYKLSKMSFGLVSSENASRALVDSDDGKTLVCTGSPAFTVNADMSAGFGVACKGTCSFVSGTATVTDVRVEGATNPWCALVQTGTNTYDAVGSKT